ncbi:ABA4-like family protein [Candidatus Pelagibacter sp.]|nr:ABA4-like family protein [Candidatus Pelagibacter sp.]
MIEQISAFFSTEMIYLWLNLGVIPFWIILIFFPQSKICNYIVVSIFPFFLLSLVYSYLLYLFYMTGYNYNQNFSLYLGLDDLRNLFSENAFLLLFWIHFLAVNLFCGCWIVKDSQKFNISKYVNFIPLFITYFIGPIGLFLYWLIRVVNAKKFNLID